MLPAWAYLYCLLVYLPGGFELHLVPQPKHLSPNPGHRYVAPALAPYDTF